MNQKNKLILLGALMVVLALVAAYVFTRPKPGRTGRKRTTVSRAAASESSTIRTAEASSELAVELELPAMTDIQAIDDWLGHDLGDAPITLDNPPVLGLPVAAASETTDSNGIIPTVRPFEEPPRLEGILWRGGTGSALIDGEAYGPGEQVAGTAFRVASLSQSEVTLKSADGREVRISLYSKNDQ